MWRKCIMKNSPLLEQVEKKVHKAFVRKYFQRHSVTLIVLKADGIFEKEETLLKIFFRAENIRLRNPDIVIDWTLMLHWCTDYIENRAHKKFLSEIFPKDIFNRTKTFSNISRIYFEDAIFSDLPSAIAIHCYRYLSRPAPSSSVCFPITVDRSWPIKY